MDENLSYLLEDLRDDLIKEAEVAFDIEEVENLSFEWYGAEWDERFE